MSKLDIKPQHTALSIRIAALSKADEKGNLQDDDIFRKIATEDGRDVDQMISDQDYRSDFMVGARLASGMIALDFMKENKDVNTVSGTFAIGRDRLELSFERHQRVANRVPVEGGGFKIDGEKDVYGESKVKLKVRGARASKGDMAAVGAFLEDNFRKAFSS